MRGIPNPARPWVNGEAGSSIGGLHFAHENPDPAKYVDVSLPGTAIPMADAPKLAGKFPTIPDLVARPVPGLATMVRPTIRATGRVAGEVVVLPALATNLLNSPTEYLPLYLSLDNGETWATKRQPTSLEMWNAAESPYPSRQYSRLLSSDLIWDDVGSRYLWIGKFTLAFSNGTAPTTFSAILSSTDLENWSKVAAVTDLGSELAPGGQYAVAAARVSDGALVMADGVRKVVRIPASGDRTPVTTLDLTSANVSPTLHHGANDEFVVTSNQTTIRHSTDGGQTWTARTVPQVTVVNSVQYGPRGWMVIRNGGLLFTDDFVTFSNGGSYENTADFAALTGTGQPQVMHMLQDPLAPSWDSYCLIVRAGGTTDYVAYSETGQSEVGNWEALPLTSEINGLSYNRFGRSGPRTFLAFGYASNANTSNVPYYIGNLPDSYFVSVKPILGFSPYLKVK